ncbi:MAG: glycogen/starch synthase [Fibrobacteria bacterium]|nr:glycogen/starch synthase [Fibrobacteria bacterium]
MRILLLTPEHPSQDPSGRGSPVGRDVDGLANAYMARGHDVRIAVPCYRSNSSQGWTRVSSLRASFLKTSESEIRVHSQWPSVRMVCHPLLERPHPYLDENGWDHSDNALRFAIYGASALLDCATEGWMPDVIHGHEWQSGLGILYASHHLADLLGCPKLLFTFQDAAFQGLSDSSWAGAIGLGPEWLTAERLEFWGRLNLLKAGLVCAHHCTTPSKHYLEALLADHHGYGLEGLFRTLTNARRVTPVTPGVDVDFWKVPEQSRESPDALLAWKQECKIELTGSEGPLLVFASAFRPGKGIDHVLTLLPDILKMDVRVGMVGGQGTEARRHLEAVAGAHPHKILLFQKGDDTLKQVLSAADFLLLPVTHQPGGVLYARSMAMGTPALAHRMGAVADQVVPCPKPHCDGYLFDDLAPDVLLKQLRKVVHHLENRAEWGEMCLRAAERDFSWDRIARIYLEILGF